VHFEGRRPIGTSGQSAVAARVLLSRLKCDTRLAYQVLRTDGENAWDV
jgi:hypothetical protein